MCQRLHQRFRYKVKPTFLHPIRLVCKKMEGVLPPLEAGRMIAETSKDVKITNEGVSKISKIMYECIKNHEHSIKSWKEHALNPKEMNKSTLDWIFFADTLNFSFWSADDSKKYAVIYDGKKHTGYWSLAAAMKRALDEGIPLTDPKYYATVTREQLSHVLRSDTEYPIPLLDERLDVILEAGKTLMAKYDGSFANVISSCDKSAQKLLKTIVSDFPSYRDVAEYNGKPVAIYKRAQILIADIWACFEGQSHGEFHDIDTITMFADYRIPQVLLYFGALEYSEELKEYLKKDHMMKTGDRYELEIRGCSIWVIELLNKETRALLDAHTETKGMICNSIFIDHFLWDYRRNHNDEMQGIPFHRIRCIYY